ncbi:MAG: PTS sugar transporter subunit IIA [Alphaproteobacteria bacterium]|nr:PTS sugar transporter subunit IIA [Alphaproteobacteria bacterium]
MKLSSILSPDDVIIGLKANSKKQVLQEMVRRMTSGLPDFDQRMALDHLMERERLGCTGIGEGIAIPHTRCEFDTANVTAPLTCLAVLQQPIDYQSNDDLPVDIVFMLLAPENIGGEHLTALALASRVLRDKSRADHLRGCTNVDAAWSIIDADPASASNAA